MPSPGKKNDSALLKYFLTITAASTAETCKTLHMYFVTVKCACIAVVAKLHMGFVGSINLIGATFSVIAPV